MVEDLGLTKNILRAGSVGCFGIAKNLCSGFQFFGAEKSLKGIYIYGIK